MDAKELTSLIKIRCGGAHYSLDEITETYRKLCIYVGIDPQHPPVGLDLVELAIEKFALEAVEIAKL